MRSFSVLLLITLFLAACSDPSSPDNTTPLTPVAEGSDGNAAGKDPQLGAVESKEGESEVDGEDLSEDGVDPALPDLPEVEIVICMSSPPASLYPFPDQSLSAEALRHAIYESLITNVGYAYQAQGLQKLPSIADGDAIIQNVFVGTGDRVVDNMGNVVTLQEDVIVINSNGEEVVFDGSVIEMEQMAVYFTLKPMVWSDGTPVTAEDSVYSFELASNSESAFRSSAVAHTFSYEATGPLDLRWVGLPGYRDQEYFTNVWPPLPAHQDESVVSATIAEEVALNEFRLSSGPFVLSEIREDGAMVLERNENYYRREEGFPQIGRILVRFGNAEDFLAGEQAEPCDVFASDVLNSGNLSMLESNAATNDWVVQTTPGPVLEYIAFGVNPVTEYAERRPDWFEDPRVRQAMTMCTDRERMVEELTLGFGEVIHTYVPTDHPMAPDDLEQWPYDPQRANALLDEAGYIDFAGDGRRQDVSSGVPMTVTLGTNSESPIRLRLTEIVQENLAECGIPIETYDLSAGTWYAAGPEGRLFGRSFDLASLAWLAKALPDCGLFAGENITGPEEFGFGGWQNLNVTGWSNEEFDAACTAAQNTLFGGDGFEANQQEALRIFARDLPAMPLFSNFKVAAVRTGIENARLDPSQRSMLWNIFEWKVAQ